MFNKRKLRILVIRYWSLITHPWYRYVEKDHIPLLHYIIFNWGDILGPGLTEKISGFKVRSIDCEVRRKYNLPLNKDEATIFMSIGSILQWADCQTIIWGSGCWSAQVKLPQKPKRVTAVRGPLTRNCLVNQGIECPEIYGDPALLLPRYFPNTETPKYDLGIVPHRSDLNHPVLEKFRKDLRVYVIDLHKINIEETLTKLLQCRFIVSSSLHGLIVPDAYGIPSHRVEFFGKVPGGNFKFDDYYASLNVNSPTPKIVDQKTTVDDLVNACTVKDITSIDLDALLEACPFRPDNIWTTAS